MDFLLKFFDKLSFMEFANFLFTVTAVIGGLIFLICHITKNKNLDQKQKSIYLTALLFLAIQGVSLCISFSSFSLTFHDVWMEEVSVKDFEDLDIVSSNDKLSDFEWYLNEQDKKLKTKNPQKIENERVAAETAYHLWYNFLEDYNKKPNKYLFKNNIYVSFDEENDVWIVKGNIGSNDPDEVVLGVVPIAIIKSNGEVVAVFFG